MIVHKTAVLVKRLTNTLAFDGEGGAAGAADVSDIRGKIAK
jgi:hypothetical protein